MKNLQKFLYWASLAALVVLGAYYTWDWMPWNLDARIQRLEQGVK